MNLIKTMKKETIVLFYVNLYLLRKKYFFYKFAMVVLYFMNLLIQHVFFYTFKKNIYISDIFSVKVKCF